MPCPEGSLIPHIGVKDLLIIGPAALPHPGRLVAVVIFDNKDIKLAAPAVVLRRLPFQSVRGLDGPVALVNANRTRKGAFAVRRKPRS